VGGRPQGMLHVRRAESRLVFTGCSRSAASRLTLAAGYPPWQKGWELRTAHPGKDVWTHGFGPEPSLTSRFGTRRRQTGHLRPGTIGRNVKRHAVMEEN
jgi:hypothetical protein